MEGDECSNVLNLQFALAEKQAKLLLELQDKIMVA